jgi:hypothetical protein
MSLIKGRWQCSENDSVFLYSWAPCGLDYPVACDGAKEYEHEEKAALLDLPLRSWPNESMPCADSWNGISCDDQCRVKSL